MGKVDLRKTVYNKTQFDKVVGGREFKTFIQEEITFSIEDFFREYENLFLSIPVNGATNSHEFLVRKSSELVGFQRTTEDIQPLLDEITSLREQLLTLQQENIDLQLGDVNENKLQDQFNELLEALSEPIELPDIILPDVNIDIGGDESEDIGSTPIFTPIDDVISVKVSSDKSVTVGTANLLENDTSGEGAPIIFEGIDQSPKYGTVEVIDDEDGIVQYTPDLRAPNGLKSDNFTYVISDGKGTSKIGKVFVNIKNELLLLTKAGDDTLVVTIEVTDKENPNSTFKVQDNIINVLDNDAGLDLAFDGIVSTPNYGTLTATNQGIISYSPRIGIRSTAGEIDLNAFFTPGAGVVPVVEDSFKYKVKNLNVANKTDIATVKIKINVLDSDTGKASVNDSKSVEDSNNTSTGTSSETDPNIRV